MMSLPLKLFELKLFQANASPVADVAALFALESQYLLLRDF
jgi:hypothetical protein